MKKVYLTPLKCNEIRILCPEARADDHSCQFDDDWLRQSLTEADGAWAVDDRSGMGRRPAAVTSRWSTTTASKSAEVLATWMMVGATAAEAARRRPVE